MGVADRNIKLMDMLLTNGYVFELQKVSTYRKMRRGTISSS
jgi:hypothetical protein